MKKYKLAVILVNYRTPELAIASLDSLQLSASDIDIKVVVIDNNSNDNSCELISNWIDQYSYQNTIDLIQSTDNSGFSGGNNRGISSIDADYYLLLNSDTVVRPGAIQKLLTAADEHPEAGLVSPRLEWLDGTPQESCFKYHTPISELINAASTGPVTKLFPSFVVAQPVKDKIDIYDWTSFACVMIRKKVFDDVGLMDDGYFMYYEDVAFAYHAQQAGWKVLNVPSAHVVHIRGGSSPVKSQAKLRKRLPRYYYESRSRYFYQVYGHSGLLAANLFWSLGWCISSLRQLVSPTFTPTLSQSQWRDIWTNFLNPLNNYIHPEDYDKT